MRLKSIAWRLFNFEAYRRRRRFRILIGNGTVRYTACDLLLALVTMALSCIASEIKRDICRKWRFFIPLLDNNPLEKTVASTLTLFFATERDGLSGGVNRLCRESTMYSPLTCVTDGRTDRQTDGRTESDLNSEAYRVTLAKIQGIEAEK